jgi:uroporphyrinogen decarboxylase
LEEYRKFGLPFDRQILQAAAGLWCNLLHLHGLNIFFELVNDYVSLFPSSLIVNWHDRETPPSLRQAQELDGSIILCGGISQHTIVFGEASVVRQEAVEALAQTGGRRFLLGTGCVVPVIAPHGNIIAARSAVNS